MRILLTNDDGIHAPGFAILESIAAKLSDDVWAVAPAEEQSGAGHSLTLTRPIRMRKLGEKKYSVSGTPTDAVMMALAHIMKDCPPDLILSGINRGANLAEDVTYSGTVSAAMEGALAGVRSVALSQVYAREGMGDTIPFAAAEAWAERVIRPLMDAPFTPGTLVNVNFPALAPDAVKGIRVCRQGIRDYGRLRIVERTDPRGYRYELSMLGFGRKFTAAAVAISLCAVPTAAIGTTSAAPVAVTQTTTGSSSSWLALSAMTTSSSAATTAAAAQGEDGAGFPPIAPLVVILATIAAAIYISVKDDSGRLDTPISPG